MKKKNRLHLLGIADFFFIFARKKINKTKNCYVWNSRLYR